jgi:dTDP-glucose 4,6-dehydratase/UDP-glucose 4-epimerase
MSKAFEEFRDARVLITGGFGFIGSNLARRLVKLGADVMLADSLIPQYGGNPFNIRDLRPHVQVSFTDVRDPHAMAYLVQGCDYLFNLAGQTSHLDSMTDPTTDLDINAAAQLSILEACRKHNPAIRIVFASTRQLYGKPEYLPVDERHPVRPVDVNGINKLAGEWYHLLYNNVYGIRACALRLTNTYGPAMRVRDARQTFLGVWIRNLVDGRPIQVFGDGLQLRDFNFVDDVVEAFLAAATRKEAMGQVFNLGSEEVINLRDLAALLVELHGSGRSEIVPFPPERKAIDIGDYYSDFTKARTELGWQPVTSLANGLRRTLDYYVEHHEAYWSAT